MKFPAILALIAVGCGSETGDRQAAPKARAPKKPAVKVAAPAPPSVKKPAPRTQVPAPDFSWVDYATDFDGLDYSKGPGGEPLTERERKSSKGYPLTEQGFYRGAKAPPPVKATKKKKRAAPKKVTPPKNEPVTKDQDDQFVLHGRQTIFLPAGLGSALQTKKRDEPRKELEQLFYNGEKHGAYTSWDIDGNVQARVAFKHGQRHGPFVMWHPSGTKKLEEFYIDGKLHGVARTWHPDGRPITEVAWVDGRREGPLKEWSPTGEVTVTYWKDGEVVFEGERTPTATFIWKLRTAADAMGRDGLLIFRSVARFKEIFGAPGSWALEGPEARGLGSPASSLGQFLRTIDSPGGQEWIYNCSDGQIGVRLVEDGKGGCAIPQNFTTYHVATP